MAKKKKRVDGSRYNLLADLFSKAKSVLLEPNRFFTRITKEKEAWKTIIYFLVIGIAVTGLWRVPFLIKRTAWKYGNITGIFGSDLALKFWLTWVPLRIIGILVLAYLINACAKLFTTKRHRSHDALKAIVYGETPYALLGWISPVIFGIWSIALYIKGINKAYRLETYQSIGALVLATLIGMCIIFIGSVIVGAVFIK